MCLHPKKSIATHQNHQRSSLRLKLDTNSKSVVPVKEHRVLGITIDDEFKWQSCVRFFFSPVKQCKKISVMPQLKLYVSSQILQIFYNSPILPHISFSSTVQDGCSESHLDKLNSLQRRVAKLLLPDKNPSTDEKLKAFSIFPLLKQLHFHKAVLMFKADRKMTPSYITSRRATTDPTDIHYLDPKNTFARPVYHYQGLLVGIRYQQSLEPFELSNMLKGITSISHNRVISHASNKYLFLQL